MSRSSQNQCWVPQLEALWRGLTEDDIAILQDALDFDGSYNGLMARLEELHASRSVYAAVNGTAKVMMGKSRSDVDLWDADEMEAWGDGYQGALDAMEAMQLYTAINEQLAREATRRGFGNVH